MVHSGVGADPASYSEVDNNLTVLHSEEGAATRAIFILRRPEVDGISSMERKWA